jgi:hypothetical protein
MSAILEFSEFNDSNLTDSEMRTIKEWVKKYEKYFNFHDGENFDSSIDQLASDVMSQTGIDQSKTNDVVSYLEELYSLSDGLSVVMAPDRQFQDTDIDQLTRFW